MGDGFLKGVKNLQDLGIVHRDLKPGNILCGQTKTGITDFGSACLEHRPYYTDSSDLIENPEKQRTIGTPGFSSPEVAYWGGSSQGPEKISCQSDIWSTGMTLWSLLTDKPIQTHPAFKGIQKGESPMFKVGFLLSPSARRARQAYEKDFPKPEDENSLLYLIWSCTRPDPEKRIDIDTLISKYNQWSEKAIQKLENGEISSIYDIFKAELAQNEM